MLIKGNRYKSDTLTLKDLKPGDVFATGNP